jgi:hypothetical protein
VGIPSALAVSGTPPAGDLANQVLTGQFVAAGVSPVIQLYGAFNVVIYGGVAPNTAWAGTVAIERSFDGGTTWIVCGAGVAGAQCVYSSGADVSIVGGEPERGVLYRMQCVVYTSGTIFYRISASGLAAMSWGIPSA